MVRVFKWCRLCGWMMALTEASTKVLGSLVGGVGGGGAKGLPIPAFRGFLPAELTSRGRYRRHSAVAAGGCRPALWSRRNSLVVLLILTVPCFKTWLEIVFEKGSLPTPTSPTAQTEIEVCDAFPDHPANSTPATSL